MSVKPLNLRLFVEGIEWPVVSAVISINPNSPAAASIQVVPADSCMDIKPRSLIFLFFRDYWQGRSSSFGFEYGEAEPPVLEDYKLLFAGELTGIAYNKSSTSRSMILTAMDFSYYWDSCWYFRGASLFGFGGQTGKWAGAAGKTLWDMFLSTGEMIYKVLKEGPKGYEIYITREKGKRVVHSQIPGLLGGIVGLLQAIGGIYHTQHKYAGTNLFFSLAELRLKLSRQLGVYPDDGPVKLLRRSGFGSIWNRTIRGLGKQFNFRRAVNALSRYIFYEVYPNPAAKYKPPTGIFAGPTADIIKNHPYGSLWADKALSIARSIDELRKKVVTDKVKIPRSEVRTNLLNMIKTCNAMIRDIKAYIEDIGPDKSRSGYEKVIASFVAARGKFRTIIKSKDILASITRQNGKFWRLMTQAETRLRAILNMTVPGHKKQVAASNPDFLYNQLFRPDLWFCAPPRCNVIFPDQYSSLSYSRDFGKEITRLLLRAPESWLIGFDVLFDKYVYAPKAIGQRYQKKLIRKKAGDVLRVLSDLMEHELYTGIIPHQEKTRGLKIFGLRDNVISQDYKVGYLQKLCNFLFFKYRFSSRGLTINGPFNPYVVAGFPAIVIDRPSPEATHYLGQIISITHSISQSGGTTTIQMGYARTHREVIKPIEADIDISKVKKRKKDATNTKTYIVASLKEPAVGNRGLYGGTIESVSHLADAEGTYPLLGTSITTRSGAITKVEVGVEKPAKQFGEQAIAMVGSPDARISFSAYSIVERLSKEEKVDELEIPFEVMVRPAWYGRCWLNERIGAVYQELLGTGSVTDPIKVVDGYFLESDEALELSGEAEQASDEDAARSSIITLETGASIRDAVDYIAKAYAAAKKGEYDVDEFIHAYVWRPIATITQILGSPDLQYDENGNRISGVEGFFSRSFGDYKDLFLLVDDSITSILGIERGEIAQSRLDVRKDRYEAAFRYILELLETEALHG